MPFPNLSGQVIQKLLDYMYTGQCLFPRDDLNLGLQLMGAADQYLLEPMKLQCERILSEKIDVEVINYVLNIWIGATHSGTSKYRHIWNPAFYLL